MDDMMNDQEPGEATVHRRDDGTRFVTRADPLILVSTELLTGELAADVVEPDGTLRLDTDGECRYQFVRAEDERTHVYQRVDSGTTERPR